MREKWRIHRGWIKVHVVIDRKTREILALEITDESVQDEATCIPLVDAAQDVLQSGHIHKILGDGAYDRIEIFNGLEDRRIMSTIKVRANASRQSHGSPYRAECVRERQDSGYEQRSQDHDYGSRWAIEGVFSAMKRIFGVRLFGQPASRECFMR